MGKLLPFCFYLLVFSVSAQQTAEKFVLETKYLLYLPEGYDTDKTKNWPLMVFLHGSGESGADLEKVKVNGPPRMIAQGYKYPMIVVSPQAPKPEGFKPDILIKMIDDLKGKYRIDADRVYLTGLSMGGYGTWKTAQEFPEVFAAIAPVCGGGTPEKAYRLAHVPVWCFHGAKDDIVLPAESEDMIKALKPLNPDVKFTLYPEANHNSWDSAYATKDLYDWMLARKRFRYSESRLDLKTADRFTGKFAFQKDTLGVERRGDSLVIYNQSSPKEVVPLRQFEKDKFFLFPDSQAEFHYIYDKRANTIDLKYVGEVRKKYRKVKPHPLKR